MKHKAGIRWLGLKKRVKKISLKKKKKKDYKKKKV